MTYEYDRSLMFRVYHSPGPDVSAFHDWLDVYLTSWEPWEGRNGSNKLPESTDELAKGEYFTASWWFHWDSSDWEVGDKSHIYDHLIHPGGSITHLTANTDWARVLYHNCTHPADDPSPCSWDEQRDHGEVPDFIESM